MNREERRRRRKLGEAVDTVDAKSMNAAKARVRAAEKHLDAGRRDDAKAALKDARLLDPENTRASYLTAMIDLNEGRLDEARDNILKAAMHDDSDPEVHANCAAILNLTGRPMEAEAAAREAVKLAPEMPEAFCNLGVALEAQGKAAPAVAALEKAIELRPGYADALISLGNLHFRSGDNVSAAETFADAVRAWPENAMARTNLAIALRHLGELAAAEEQCVEAIQLDPGYGEAFNALGNVRLQLGDLPGAIEAFEGAIARRKGYPEAQANLAGAKFKAGDYEGAETAFIETLEAFPTFAEAAHGLGVVYLAQGRVEDAVTRFRRAVELRPGFGEAWMNIVDAADGKLSDDDYKALCDKADDSRLPEEDRIGFQFALGKAEHARGNHAAAFTAYHAANVRRIRLDEKAETDFDPDAFDEEIDNVINILSKNSLLELKDMGDAEARPVLICGMPRSGTTLIEQMIAAHPDAEGAGEVDIFSGLLDAYPEDLLGQTSDRVRDLADAYIRRLPKTLRGGQVVTDKTPQNVFFLGLAQVLFPNARVIHCQRMRADVAWSCYTQNFKAVGMNWTSDFGHIERYMAAEARMMAHWRDTLDLPIFEAVYEDVVRDPEAAARDVLEFIGLDWNAAAARPHESANAALTASNWQVRKPVYTSAVGRAKPYGEHLARFQ